MSGTYFYLNKTLCTGYTARLLVSNQAVEEFFPHPRAGLICWSETTTWWTTTSSLGADSHLTFAESLSAMLSIWPRRSHSRFLRCNSLLMTQTALVRPVSPQTVQLGWHIQKDSHLTRVSPMSLIKDTILMRERQRTIAQRPMGMNNVWSMSWIVKHCATTIALTIVIVILLQMAFQTILNPIGRDVLVLWWQLQLA